MAQYLECAGTEIVSRVQWEHIQFLVPSWSDLDLPQSRVLSNLVWAVVHNSQLEEHTLDCGFGLLTAILIALRAIEYDYGRSEAQSLYRYARSLIGRLEPVAAIGREQGWDIDLTDLAIYPQLLGLEPQHDCYGTELRIFVYPLHNLTRGVLHCQHGQWGLEALIPHWLRMGTCLTNDWHEANYFLVPWHTWCDRMVYPLNQTRNEITHIYEDLINRREETLPYWSRFDGRDHIFIFSDQGMNYFPTWREYIPHSVFFLTEGLTPECGPTCYNPWKDVILPGHTDYFRYRRMMPYNKPTAQRQLLFNFHGRHPGLHHFYKDNYVRGNIIEIFTDKPGVSVGGFTDDYFERMGSSHFCLVPMGTSSWTNHLYESFFAGCIPVILSDDFELPFEDLLNWNSISLKWPQRNVSMDLYYYLRSFDLSRVAEMKAAVDAHACWFDYHNTIEPAGKACSPYAAILKVLEKRKVAQPRASREMWNHQLVKIRMMKSSGESG
eukprot:gnl/MRDRNA2_/MRDRNA2_70167_c0_seq1.p1 gnl/MRDRNA2_/MRDRNA2_70167_c0~~gnl/MRDRNA2_/MRDRNA2_70167_c0_seq1.p1  ORF type:complete len:494 (+),score=53.39 gnl/MRDRNA2_/MRDRNA2_70167_c0_seq1:164-1645(+)